MTRPPAKVQLREHCVALLEALNRAGRAADAWNNALPGRGVANVDPTRMAVEEAKHHAGMIAILLAAEEENPQSPSGG